MPLGLAQLLAAVPICSHPVPGSFGTPIESHRLKQHQSLSAADSGSSHAHRSAARFAPRLESRGAEAMAVGGGLSLLPPEFGASRCRLGRRDPLIYVDFTDDTAGAKGAGHFTHGPRPSISQPMAGLGIGGLAAAGAAAAAAELWLRRNAVHPIAGLSRFELAFALPPRNRFLLDVLARLPLCSQLVGCLQTVGRARAGILPDHAAEESAGPARGESCVRRGDAVGGEQAAVGGGKHGAGSGGRPADGPHCHGGRAVRAAHPWAPAVHFGA